MASTTASSSRGHGGGVVAIVLGAIVGLLALAVLAAGGAALWADQTQRDADGYFTTVAHRYETSGHAITHEGADLTGIPGWIDTGKLAVVRIDASAVPGSGPVFVGIAPQSSIDAYLAGVAHDRLRDIQVDPLRPSYAPVAGDARPAAPTTERFWAAQASGGRAVLSWRVQKGTWGVVVMNADGSAQVAADISLGAKVGYLGWVWGGLIGGGALLLAVGGLLIALGARRRGSSGSGPGGGVADDRGARRATPSASGLGGTYPAALTARLDEPLSRGLWLVKWLLLLPHVLVLAVLLPVFAVLTVVAGVAILLTGRYPRGIFDFNVGVLRWAWRVHYYGYGALGTDAYPPFSLDDVPGYPARLEIAYPERLSRGLVLVKWLLALPHLLIVGLVGSAGFWFGHDTWPGLVTLLALIAGVALLVGKGYPRGLFDLLLGLNRWMLRTVAYVALLTDEYPPFRLDAGGEEPHEQPHQQLPGSAVPA